MAVQITEWSYTKIFLFFFDAFILFINIVLFFFTYYLIRKEYNKRASLQLFIIPFFVSIVNIFIDFLMNKINYNMKYAGHNRYGMITRFFMFYFVLIIMIFTDQREKYILKEKKENIIDISFWIEFLGIIDIGLIVFSMILSFFIIDTEVKKQKAVKKERSTILDAIELDEIEKDDISEESKKDKNIEDGKIVGNGK